jgi:hypothetical protein
MPLLSIVIRHGEESCILMFIVATYATILCMLNFTEL